MGAALGIIGAGMIGGTIARLAVDAGIRVVIANSRGPKSLAPLVEELGELASAGTPAEAAQAGDIVVVTIPLHRLPEVSAEELTGRIVVDTMNYYPERDGRIAVLDSGERTSSQLVQDHLAGAAVVKAINSIAFFSLGMMARPSGSSERSALPIAGDDGAAKRQVATLLDRLGYDAVDLGGLGESWRSEPNSPVYVDPYLPGAPPSGGEEEFFRWIRETPVVPVPAGRIRVLADSAIRGVSGGTFPPGAG